MKSPLAKAGFFLAMLSATLPSVNCRYEWRVHVINGLSTLGFLLVHCQSKDNDLGVHSLSMGGEFRWHFSTNILGTTLFWCYLAPNSTSHVSFKAFWVDAQLFRECKHGDCIWTARDDGIYIKDFSTDKDLLQHKWENGSLQKGKSGFVLWSD